jgi:hypothetical protein
VAAHATHAAGVGLSAPLPAPATRPDLNCCFDSAGATAQAIVPTQLPAPPLPVAVALLSALLGLVALQSRAQRALPQAAPHPSGLHQQAVLFRI